MNEKRKLAAVMFTDIAGYTTLMSRDEKQALALLQKNRDLQKSLAEKHHGEFLKEMGDGTLLCLQSALDAVRCAMEIQRSVQDDPDLNLRIGIHLGDIVFKDSDVFGDGVNIASRIEGLAESGGVCISEEIDKSIRNYPEINTEFIGEKQLKNIGHPVKVYRLGISSRERNSLPEPTETDKKSIIVLPFDDMSPDKDNEYFNDGLIEEIITDLSHIHDLIVISRSSAMTFKGKDKKIKEIAREVNVQYVLEGSVRKAENNLRITAQLIDATTDAHLWAEKYSGTLDDVFDIQEQVSLSIVDALKVKLSPKENKQILERPIDNVQAYECYHRAVWEMQMGTADGIERALRDLQLGLDIIGDNVLLFAGMGSAYCYFYEFGIQVTEETLSKAEEYAFKAHRLEPNSSVCYTLLGRIERFRGCSTKAMKYFKQALSIDPNDQEVLLWLGHLYSFFQGRPDIATPMLNKVVDRDPLSPLIHMVLGGHYWVKGEYDNSLNSYENALKLEPNIIFAKVCIAALLFWLNQYDKACAVIDRIEKESADQMHKVFTAWLLFLKHAIKGEKDKALELITDDVKSYFWNDPEFMWMGICNYALINEKEEAINWLERFLDKGFINYPFLNGFPFLENIRGEERFKKLMEGVKHEWENFEV
ncbi:MAG: adenylate/guanylate cyclase domain-containing protein [Bacteroidota bacterium]